MRIKTLDKIMKKVAVILAIFLISSGCILMYFFFFDRVKLLVELLFLFPLGLPHFVSLGPITMGFLLSIDYTTFGLIWEGWLVVPMNSELRLTLMLVLFVSLIGIYLLVPLGLFMPLSKVSDYEIRDVVKDFKSLIWRTKEGKRIVVSKVIIDTIYFIVILLILLSGFYVLRQDTILMVTFSFLFSITGLLNILIL
ncbi:MAG: hypothetical protein QXO71_02295 [Candidatus Jordarchaeaceae archaeon]